MRRKLLTISLLAALGSCQGISATAPKPLFSDPNYHGSCDPEIVWNEGAKEWWIFYTARRATRKEGGVAAACPIGVAASKDWRQWTFKGYCRFDGQDNQPDAAHTYWAPGIARDGDRYHMFVVFRAGTNGFWGSDNEGIRHYVANAADLLDWRYAGRPIPDVNAIDAGLLKKGQQWLMYYRDKKENLPRGTTTFWATSTNLTEWTMQGPARGDVNDPKVTGFNYQEAQYPFRWKGTYWLLTDPSGPPIAVYRAQDAVNWKYVGNILDTHGKDPTDKSFGRHPSVAVIGDRAFIFYHVEPDRDYSKPYPRQAVENRRCYLQVAELKLDGDRVTCDRDEPVILP